MALLLGVSDSSGTTRSVRISLLQQGGLSESQAAAVIEAANSFRATYDEIKARALALKAEVRSQSPSTVPTAQYDAIFASGWRALEANRQKLEQGLGQNGKAQLQRCVDTIVKPTLNVVRGKQ